MIRLNLPPFEMKISGTKQQPKILDILRRKYIALTPEEWVRQHFIHFLIEHKGYPAALLANEIQLQCGDKVLRADSVLYSRELQPRMIIEYKAPHIPITQKFSTKSRPTISYFMLTFWSSATVWSTIFVRWIMTVKIFIS